MDTKDRFGACVICHRDLLIEQVVDGRVLKFFSSEKSDSEFILADKSRMRVCVCTPCKKITDLSDPTVQDNIMKSVIAGWQWETIQLVSDPTRPEWTQEKADAYLTEYCQHTIDCHCEETK